MSRLVTLDFYREGFGFHIAHFSLFSATERERWHGHNYSVSASLVARINEPGITFNYAIFKNKLSELCKQLDCYFILPAHSPYLNITEEGDSFRVIFHKDEMRFLKKDVLLLPIENTTLEDFSQWFIHQLSAEHDFIKKYGIQQLTVNVFNSTTQSARATWEAAHLGGVT